MVALDRAFWNFVSLPSWSGLPHEGYLFAQIARGDCSLRVSTRSTTWASSIMKEVLAVIHPYPVDAHSMHSIWVHCIWMHRPPSYRVTSFKGSALVALSSCNTRTLSFQTRPMSFYHQCFCRPAMSRSRSRSLCRSH